MNIFKKPTFEQALRRDLEAAKVEELDAAEAKLRADHNLAWKQAQVKLLKERLDQLTAAYALEVERHKQALADERMSRRPPQ